MNSGESEDIETVQADPEDMRYPYYSLEVDDPAAQTLIGDDNGGFMSRLFIKGLIGYTSSSGISGMLENYIKDTEIIIKENRGFSIGMVCRD